MTPNYDALRFCTIPLKSKLLFYISVFFIIFSLPDVTMGATEVFLSPESEMFIVDTNKTTWQHEVTFDPNFEILSDPNADLDDEDLTLKQKLSPIEHFMKLPNYPLVTDENEKHSRIRRANIRLV